MNRTLRIIFIIITLTLICNKGFSQISISYYDSSLPKIGFGYNISEKAWGELRLYSNTTFNDLTPELVLCYNVIKKERHNIYVGIGGNANFFNGLVVPIGV